MSISTLRFSLLLSSMLVISGCGFQLKGSQDDGKGTLSGMQVAVISAEPRSELTSALLQQLSLAGVAIATPGADVLNVKLGVEQFTQRNLSLTAQARAAEIELRLSTVFSAHQDQQEHIIETQVQVVRQMLNDPRNVTGKTEEIRLFREEMRRDLAVQIVRRLNNSLAE